MESTAPINNLSLPNSSRSRIQLLCCTVGIIVLGLASRKYPFLFPGFLGKYPGDALWSLMVYFGLALLKPALPTRRAALYTLAISYLDEFSQLIQIPWLNAFRHTTIGHLLLGTVFSWTDMLAYTAGVFLAVLLDRLLFKPMARQ